LRDDETPITPLLLLDPCSPLPCSYALQYIYAMSPKV
jgi:hypothetical protein